MANQHNEEDFSASPSAAARPAAQTFNRGQNPRRLDETGDPFIEDMTEVANETVFDGNAQINSPQEDADDQGSPGTSR